jgi:MOSC domain-containing protein YiiM
MGIDVNHDSKESSVVAVHRKEEYGVFKEIQESVHLVKGFGVQGDAHMGTLVQHRYNKKQNPNQPNLRQVHLIQAELFDDLKELGLIVKPGEMGENITTRNIDIINLPLDTKLHLGDSAILQLTGLREPCGQLNTVQKGLKNAVLDESGKSRVGVMSVVLRGGAVKADDLIRVELPSEPHQDLQPV